MSGDPQSALAVLASHPRYVDILKDVLPHLPEARILAVSERLEGLAEAGGLAAYLTDQINVEDYAGLIVCSGWEPGELNWGAKFRNVGKPVLVIEHGTLLVYNGEARYRNWLGCGSVSTCWGVQGKRIFEQYGCPGSQLQITGAPELDRLYGKTPKRDGVPSAIFAGATWPISWREKSISSWDVLRKNHVGFELYYKLHPVEKESPERFTLETFGADGILHGNIADILPNFNVLITTCSSVMIHASAIGMPVVYLRNDLDGFNQEVEQFMHICSHPTEITSAVEKAMEEGVKDSNAAALWVEKTAYRFDGQRGKAVADFAQKVTIQGSSP
ncbi:hypothetical protein D5125_17330 [Magnetovirga frankeli]|uniref:hypothetical protein n=1 Tax=Magnetovirga frankeli TaxID=947516 RepID=UPI00129363AA|nr:hypothetical protein D5125_17330 [gamma proteobacterium SS-5]